MNTNGSFFNFTFLLDLNSETERNSLLSLISGKTLYSLITGEKQEKNHSSIKELIASVIQIIDDYLIEDRKSDDDTNRLTEISLLCSNTDSLDCSISFYSSESLKFVSKVLKTKALKENIFGSKEPKITKEDLLYTLSFKLKI